MSREDWRTLRHHMRTPVLAFIALLALLGINGALGVFVPFQNVWAVEAAIAVTMVLIVLAFTMELVEEPPVLPLFTLISFFWVAILFSLTLLDYLTR
jgi:cytochrome c oxidase subunit 4